jgi:3-oxoadipate enol-lactonase
MKFAFSNGIALHYEEHQMAAGLPALVFVNSLGCDLRIWDDVVSRLAPHFGILTYDKRGHGVSDQGEERPHSLGHHVADLAGLLDRQGTTQAIICGLSVGGMIALGLQAARPDLVRALVLCDTAPRIGTAESWNGRIRAIEQGGIAAVADGILANWLTGAYRNSATAAFAGWRNMLIRQPPAGYVATCAAIRDADFTVAAKSVSVPTLCVAGESDGSTPPELVAAMTEIIPGARLEVIRKAAHLPCIEQPAALASLIEDFVQKLPAGTRRHE